MIQNVIRKVARYKVILTLVIFVSFLILITDLSPDLYFINFGTVDDVSCHYEKTSDVIKPVNELFAPASNSIYFHETSCRGSLSSKQACSIESAARGNPNREIYVLFSAPVKENFKDAPIDLTQIFPNIQFRRVHIVEYAKDTAVEKLVENGALNRTRWPISHTSDILRILTLYKWGGVYLDLDVVVAKPLDELPKNWVAKESRDYVASSLLSFYRDDVGRMFADAVLRDLEHNFRGDSWAHNGPDAITRVIRKICGSRVLTEDMFADTCEGLVVFGPELFFPIRWQEAIRYFEPGEISQEPYTYHVWNRITQDAKLQENSVYAKLARKYCPSVHDAYGSAFGN